MDASRLEDSESPPHYGLWAGVIVGWWTVNGFVSASQYYFLRSSSEMPITWVHALTTGMTSAYLWVPITVLVFWLGWRYRLERGRWARSLTIHLVAALGVVLLRAGLLLLLNPWVGWYTEVPPFSRLLLTSFTNNFFLYWMLVGVAHAVHYAHTSRQRERHAERLQTELVRTQLHALKAQLHPHFLFNTLNTVASFVHSDPDAAERMIARLSELLRRTLGQRGAEEIPLQEELDFLRAYLEIEQARFEDRLQVHWDIDPATLEARIPPLLLQPLVENAIRHGIAPRSAAGRVEICSQRSNGALHLQVRDDGVGLPQGGDSVTDGGVGLASTRSRLEQMYGTGHRFHLAAAPGGGVLVEVTLPFRRIEER
jgi:two-component system, LytTR family, sensor kinase